MAAILGGGAQRCPARLPKRLVRVFEARRHGDIAIFPLCAHMVAHGVEWGNLLSDELAAFFQNLVDQIGIDFAVGRECGNALWCMQYVVQHELNVI